jgi:uncharacterized membrane protein
LKPINLQILSGDLTRLKIFGVAMIAANALGSMGFEKKAFRMSYGAQMNAFEETWLISPVFFLF